MFFSLFLDLQLIARLNQLPISCDKGLSQSELSTNISEKGITRFFETAEDCNDSIAQKIFDIKMKQRKVSQRKVLQVGI